MRVHLNPITDSLGIVLSRRHHEKETRLHLFLKTQGKIIAVLKGAHTSRSKLKTLQEPFVFADYQIYLAPNSVVARVINGKLIQSHTILRQNLEAFGIACQMAESIELLLPFRAPAPDIFEILRLGLSGLQHRLPPRLTKLWFLFHLLKTLGHGDMTRELTALMAPGEREKLKSFLEDNRMSAAKWEPTLASMPLDRVLLFLERQLGSHLPKEMKSSLFEKSLLTQTQELDNLLQYQ